MKTIGLLVSIIIIINSCTNTIRQNEETHNEDIYINWQVDSLGCNGFRQNIYKTQISDFKQKLIGKTQTEIISLLGPPNEEYKHSYNTALSYYIEPGIQCYEWNTEPSDAIRLEFIISEHKVIDAHVMAP